MIFEIYQNFCIFIKLLKPLVLYYCVVGIKEFESDLNGLGQKQFYGFLHESGENRYHSETPLLRVKKDGNKYHLSPAEILFKDVRKKF